MNLNCITGSNFTAVFRLGPTLPGVGILSKRSTHIYTYFFFRALMVEIRTYTQNLMCLKLDLFSSSRQKSFFCRHKSVLFLREICISLRLRRPLPKARWFLAADTKKSKVGRGARWLIGILLGCVCGLYAVKKLWWKPILCVLWY